MAPKGMFVFLTPLFSIFISTIRGTKFKLVLLLLFVILMVFFVCVYV